MPRATNANGVLQRERAVELRGRQHRKALDGAPIVPLRSIRHRADELELGVLPPKTERSRRSVPLPPSLIALLREHRADQLERRLLAGPAWHAGEYVFDRGDGQPMDPDTFSKAFRDAARAVGLDGVRLHDLRHGFASMLVAAGTNVRVVSDTLGHATVGFTLQTYTHPDEQAAAAVAEHAERLLWGESGANDSRR